MKDQKTTRLELTHALTIDKEDLKKLLIDAGHIEGDDIAEFKAFIVVPFANMHLDLDMDIEIEVEVKYVKED